jgi:hypothetical protein
MHLDLNESSVNKIHENRVFLIIHFDIVFWGEFHLLSFFLNRYLFFIARDTSS